ncbi:hypothetical protein BN341_1210 [Helicobacter heilmannii ASB1.4]|nr:hypothetical protein BN341_1210 [Helicobacter heilmannii ASB1.4]
MACSLYFAFLGGGGVVSGSELWYTLQPKNIDPNNTPAKIALVDKVSP